jgi:hypothetical protein
MGNPERAVIDRENPLTLGKLRHTWTDVDGLRIHALVSVESVSLDAPAIVLVHGSGLSGRYMIRQPGS